MHHTVLRLDGKRPVCDGGQLLCIGQPKVILDAIAFDRLRRERVLVLDEV